MKKLLLVALVSSAFVGYSQESYFSVSVGYGLGVPGESSFESIRDTNNEGTDKVKNVNYGGGINATISYGVPLAENVHLDLALSYQNNLGSSIEDRDYDWQPGPGFSGSYVEMVSTSTVKTSSFRFAPSLRFSGGDGNIRPFAKVGPQVILASMKTKYETTSGTNSFLSEAKYSMAVSVGAVASVGVEFEAADDLWFFASLDASLGYYAPSKGELVTYEIDGKNELDMLDTYDKEVEFEKELSTDAYNSDPDKPDKQLKMRNDFSSVGLSFGVRLLL